MKNVLLLISILTLLYQPLVALPVNNDRSPRSPRNPGAARRPLSGDNANGLTARRIRSVFRKNRQHRYSLRISNDSRWDIHRIYMSSAEVTKWGPDQLGTGKLRAGGVFTITDITPGEYDIMFVDEDSDRCVLRNVQIFENKTWTITSDWLVKCQRGR